MYAHGSPPAVIDKATDADGRFRIEAPSAFRYGVRAVAEGFKPFQDDSLVITRPSYDIDILLTPTLTLRGRVLDNLGAGVGAALVRLRRQGERSGGFLSTTTDPQGAFLFTDIPREGRYSVDAYHPGFDAAGPPANASVPSEDEVLLRMRPARAIGSLVGNVTDTMRRPVAGARITLFDPSDRRSQSQVQGQTDAKGVYRFARVREGYFVVRCSADGYLESRSNQGAIAVTADKEARLDFILEPGFLIRGSVVNQKGEPVLQALLVFTAEDGQRSSSTTTATTDDSGRFQILNLRDAQYTVTVTHRDYLDTTAHMRPSSQPQTITIDSGLSLRGTVSDPAGSAVEKFSLLFQSTTSRTSKYAKLTTTDGKFEVQGLSRDTYQVRLQAYGTLYTGPLELQISTEVFIVLDPPPGVRTSREGRGGGEGRRSLPLNILKSK